jgi:hypothetical protein
MIRMRGLADNEIDCSVDSINMPLNMRFG